MIGEFQPASSVVFTLPGKLGDNLARLPIACRYARERGQEVDICVDEHTAPSLLPLLARLPWVSQAFVASGIVHDGCGGQPWDFGAPQWFAERYSEVYHLGYRGFPRWLNLTMASVPPNYPPDLCALGLDGFLSERPLDMEWDEEEAARIGFALVVSAESSRPHADAATLATVEAAGERLGRMVLTHRRSGRNIGAWNRYEWYGGTEDDNKDGLRGAAHLFCRYVVVTTYSALCQLATLVGAPCVVLIPPGGYGLGHYDTRTRWYPGWEIATEGDPDGLVQAVDRAIASACGVKREELTGTPAV